MLIDDQGSINDPYRNFIAISRYARWLPEQNRRETWTETVDRYVDNVIKVHLDPADYREVDQIRTAILNHEIMPSMRAMMTAGPALDREPLCQYNCAFIAVNSPRSFDEALYILMNGVGLGFSVESEHVSLLPVVNEHFESSGTTIVVEDSKAGWARAFRELIAMLYAGQIPVIDVSKVRPAGARLKTFGGRASGPQVLVDLFSFTIKKFRNAAGRKLSTVECHDIMCKVGDVVVVGGVRRAALISLSDLKDYEMGHAKSGAWWELNPQRRLSNNSAAYTRKPGVGEFLTEWTSLYESKSGERGIYNKGLAQSQTFAPRRDGSKVEGLNPCGEINLRHAGLCNLSEVIVRPEDTLETLKEKVRLATIIGTIQSKYTDFKYLRRVWQNNAEEERLLGVSLTGQFGNALLSGRLGLGKLATALDALRETAIETNDIWAGMFDIPQSVAITTVKPSGTVSQLTGSSSGMHPWHSPYFLRAVRGDNKDPLTKFLIDAGVPSEPELRAPDDTTVFYFPTKAPVDGVTRDDMSAIEHLEVWRRYKIHWTEHNPSITVTVKEHEWIEVADWVYKHWDIVGGISFLPYADHTYEQAPYQEIDITTYKQFMADMPANIDWSLLAAYETDDNTTGSQSLACVSGECEIVDITNKQLANA
jgi:ribonucleoside-diphosphate reductase alpha chain